MEYLPKIFRDQDRPRCCSPRRCTAVPGPPPGGRIAPAGSRVAVLGKRWVPPLLENLQQGLLDQSIDDARDAELSDPAIRLGDFDPLDRLRLRSCVAAM